mmetsp:Transcript_53637/g.95354  ORF Transcript_53637/g.95354 Transcript_53637/m.95354 type:complete len:241 (+) Transcript_53637:789-1511(+)
MGALVWCGWISALVDANALLDAGGVPDSSQSGAIQIAFTNWAPSDATADTVGAAAIREVLDAAAAESCCLADAAATIPHKRIEAAVATVCQSAQWPEPRTCRQGKRWLVSPLATPGAPTSQGAVRRREWKSAACPTAVFHTRIWMHSRQLLSSNFIRCEQFLFILARAQARDDGRPFGLHAQIGCLFQGRPLAQIGWEAAVSTTERLERYSNDFLREHAGLHQSRYGCSGATTRSLYDTF